MNGASDCETDGSADGSSGLEHGASQGLVFSWEGLGTEETEAGVDCVGAEGGETHCWEAVGPPGCGGGDGGGEEEVCD